MPSPPPHGFLGYDLPHPPLLQLPKAYRYLLMSQPQVLDLGLRIQGVASLRIMCAEPQFNHPSPLTPLPPLVTKVQTCIDFKVGLNIVPAADVAGKIFVSIGELVVPFPDVIEVGFGGCKATFAQ
ncbi:hypothetical protein E1B28_006932 [Marasmius oreades]|uniref:Uncharacterized protein n=1 Tax=Marasmius oreades TaxID=181124 RepID=A0A9P7S1Y5_9AGAR|nr:uncharacterized protein E1B28_006932 [Marasmius oreades]KAG7093246.1 hypothetical protein E1B28_006932 [Marasmius oreades]